MPSRPYAPWTFDADLLTLDLKTPTAEYQIDLERCNTPAEMLDWIFQVHSKTWATPAILAGLLQALYDVIDPQASLCSFGNPSSIKDMRAHIEALRRSGRR